MRTAADKECVCLNNEEMEEKRNGFLKKISDWKNYGKIWSSSRES